MPNPHWAKLPLFDRKGWKTVRFGDVVENDNDTVRVPAEAGITRFIGLEHMQPGSLHIREWGNVADGTTFTRRCQPGQVLFGKRRAYQRKVSVAEFEAVVSGDIYVLTPKGDWLLPDVLPFICLSERFFRHAVGTSAGSLSPRTNWSSLASFEFAIPLIDQQRRIAEILLALDLYLQSMKTLQIDLTRAKHAFFDDQLQKHTRADPKTLRTLDNILLGIVAGKSPKSSSNPASNNQYGVLKVSAAGDGVFREEENKALLNSSDFVSTLEVKPGMILVTRCNALLSGIGRACLVQKARQGLMLSDKTLQLIPNYELVDRDFLLQGLQREPYRGFVERSANGTDAKNISQESLRAAPFWIPCLTQQREILEQLSRFVAAVNMVQQQEILLVELRSTLLREFVQ